MPRRPDLALPERRLAYLPSQIPVSPKVSQLSWRRRTYGFARAPRGKAVPVHQRGQQPPKLQGRRVSSDGPGRRCGNQVGQLKVGDVSGVSGQDGKYDAAGLDVLCAIVGQRQCVGEPAFLLPGAAPGLSAIMIPTSLLSPRNMDALSYGHFRISLPASAFG